MQTAYGREKKMKKYKRLVVRAALIALRLFTLGIDPREGGGRALLCCALVACSGRPKRISDLCAWYAEFKGVNSWTIHKRMSTACIKSGCGLSPKRLICALVREVKAFES